MGEVFTLLMGNPTWDKLGKLLGTLGIPNALDKEFASTGSMKSHFANAKWTEVLKESESFHESALRRRNSIVHNIIPISLVEEDVRDTLKFYGAFATALNELIAKYF